MKKVNLLCIFLLLISYIPGQVAIAKQRNEEYYEFLQATTDAKRIPIDEAYKIYQSGEAILISVDGSEYFEARHIVGAINIPYDKLERIMEKGELNVPKDKPVLLYCR